MYFSIHALLAESDSNGGNHYSYIREFFYPRSPCGERPLVRLLRTYWYSFSIHALLAESDHRAVNVQSPNANFLSTLSLRRATAVNLHPETRKGLFYPRSPCGERPPMVAPPYKYNDFSIHALLAESDKTGIFLHLTFHFFYPRSPCGERLE